MIHYNKYDHPFDTIGHTSGLYIFDAPFVGGNTQTTCILVAIIDRIMSKIAYRITNAVCV